MIYWKPNFEFAVCDAGGSTVDITSYVVCISFFYGGLSATYSVTSGQIYYTQLAA